MSILKREYMIIPIIPIGAYLYIYTKTTLFITLLVKNIQQLFLQPHKYKKRIKQYTTLSTQKITTNQPIIKTIKTKTTE